MPIRVVLIDDHHIIRDGIRRSLPVGEIEVIAEGGLGNDALVMCTRKQFDVMVLDSELPDLPVIDILSELNQRMKALRVVVLVQCIDEAEVVSLVRLGVSAIVSKTDAITNLIEAIKSSHRGDCYFTPQITTVIMSTIAKPGWVPPNAETAMLTPREYQTLRLITQAKSSKDIATILNLELSTVRSYRKRLMEKLDVHSVSQLMTRAIQLKLIPAPGTRSNDGPIIPRHTEEEEDGSTGDH